jgi:hypothetical protein
MTYSTGLLRGPSDIRTYSISILRRKGRLGVTVVHCKHGCIDFVASRLGGRHCGNRASGRDDLYPSRLLDRPKLIARPANGRQAADQRRGPADRGQRGEAAGTVAEVCVKEKGHRAGGGLVAQDSVLPLSEHGNTDQKHAMRCPTLTWINTNPAHGRYIWHRDEYAASTLNMSHMRYGHER